MLDRIDVEVTRATSTIRFAPTSHFSRRVHEEAENAAVSRRRDCSAAREDVSLEHWDRNLEVILDARGGIETRVLEGSFAEAGAIFPEQSWLRLPMGSRLAARAGPEDCPVWIKEGHLRHVRSMAPPRHPATRK